MVESTAIVPAGDLAAEISRDRGIEKELTLSMVHVVRDVTGRDADVRQFVAREELREEFHRLEERLGGKFDHMSGMFDAKLSILETGLRSDMATLAANHQGDMRELRGEMTTLAANHQGDMRELRGEMAALGANHQGDMRELRGEMATLAANHQGDMKELRSDMGALEHRLTGEFRRQTTRQIGWMVGTMLVFMGVFTGALFAAARFLAIGISGSP